MDGGSVQTARAVQLFLSPSMMFGALFTFPKEMKMLLKERSSGMYHLAAYYIARTIATLPLDALYPTSFTVIVYGLARLRPGVRPCCCL
jgi:hypothetical protein